MLPRAPCDAAFNSRLQSSAMLGCVARKNAKNLFFYNLFLVLLASLVFFHIFLYFKFDRLARLYRSE